MPTKSDPSPRRSPGATEETTDTLEIVVRRGATRRFDALQTQTADLPVVVTWDRRTDDRRASATRLRQMDVPRDRRASDRRREPPFTWDLADFVVVASEGAPQEPRNARAKKPGSEPIW